MRMLKFTGLVFCLLISLNIDAQKSKIERTYIWDMTEYLTIVEDSFKLYLYPTYPFLYGLNIGDTILAEGKVEYESNNFIKLTSKDYEWEERKNITIKESVDLSLIDSIKFKFVFPFDGKYKIILNLENNNKEKKYEFQDKNEFTLPALQCKILTFSFSILNQTPIQSPYRVYTKTVNFDSPQIEIKENDSNSFEILIPNLSNSYFNRFLINGEYVRFDPDNEVLFWRNKKYLKRGSIND